MSRLILGRVDADRFGGVFVFADRDEVIPHPGSFDQPGDHKPDREQAERDIVIGGLGLELHHQRRVAEVRDGGAFGAPGEIAKFEEDQHQGLRGGDGGDGEIGAAQAKAQPADRQACQHRHHAAGDHPDPRRDAEIDLQDGRGVGAKPEISGVTERKLLGVAAHQVPGDADEGEQQNPDEDVDRKRAGHHQRQCDEDDGPAASQSTFRVRVCDSVIALSPPRPVGLKASVNSSMANTTINPESAPMY